jgi:hypothetical protein
MGEVEMKVEVVCYSGYKGDERPVRFQLGGEDYFVEELLDQWYWAGGRLLQSASERRQRVHPSSLICARR